VSRSHRDHEGVLGWLRVQRDRVRPLLARLRRTLWLRPLIYGALAACGVWLGVLADRLPVGLEEIEVDQELASSLLSVLSASMLGVATFAVASMVSAYASAGQVATPRAFDLIVGDDRSKTALSAFVASFVFATVGDIALSSDLLGADGRVVLFAQTLLVYFGVITTFLRWVDSIARLGRLQTAIARVEEATAKALDLFRETPRLGAAPAGLHDVRDHPVTVDEVGYVVDVDLPGLQRIADEHDVKIEVTVVPGRFLGPSVPVVWSSDPLADEASRAIRGAFAIEPRRGFDADPANGFVVLAEIGSRALSPGINDSGTAVEVIRSATRLLLLHAPKGGDDEEPRYPDVGMPDLRVEHLLESFVPPIARDGAGRSEVIDALRESLDLVGAEPAFAELARSCRSEVDRHVA